MPRADRPRSGSQNHHPPGVIRKVGTPVADSTSAAVIPSRSGPYPTPAVSTGSLNPRACVGSGWWTYQMPDFAYRSVAAHVFVSDRSTAAGSSTPNMSADPAENVKSVHTPTLPSRGPNSIRNGSRVSRSIQTVNGSHRSSRGEALTSRTEDSNRTAGASPSMTSRKFLAAPRASPPKNHFT